MLPSNPGNWLSVVTTMPNFQSMGTRKTGLVSTCSRPLGSKVKN
jgi:hypothetical protein